MWAESGARAGDGVKPDLERCEGVETIKGVGKAHNIYYLSNKVTPIYLMTGLLHKNPNKCCTQESLGGSGLVTSTKTSFLYNLMTVWS